MFCISFTGNTQITFRDKRNIFSIKRFLFLFPIGKFAEDMLKRKAAERWFPEYSLFKRKELL